MKLQKPSTPTVNKYVQEGRTKKKRNANDSSSRAVWVANEEPNKTLLSKTVFVNSGLLADTLLKLSEYRLKLQNVITKRTFHKAKEKYRELSTL
jgi:L-2-hydroxyglutarate oxidase LhgO